MWLLKEGAACIVEPAAGERYLQEVGQYVPDENEMQSSLYVSFEIAQSRTRFVRMDSISRMCIRSGINYRRRSMEEENETYMLVMRSELSTYPLENGNKAFVRD